MNDTFLQCLGFELRVVMELQSATKVFVAETCHCKELDDRVQDLRCKIRKGSG